MNKLRKKLRKHDVVWAEPLEQPVPRAEQVHADEIRTERDGPDLAEESQVALEHRSDIDSGELETVPEERFEVAGEADDNQSEAASKELTEEADGDEPQDDAEEAEDDDGYEGVDEPVELAEAAEADDDENEAVFEERGEGAGEPEELAGLDRSLPAAQFFSAIDWSGSGEASQRPGLLADQIFSPVMGGRAQPAQDFFAHLPWNGQSRIATLSRKDMARMMAMATRQAINTANRPVPSKTTAARTYFSSLDWHKSQGKGA